MHSLPTIRARGWIIAILLALTPMWLIGTLDRGAWTPDEPREADIAWRMSVQRQWVLPQLANQPFLEKPPLTYWMSAASMRLFGPTVRAARAPNLLYAAVTALAMGTLGLAMDGVAAAIVAALVAGSAITAFRVTVWLAPDACLLAGCAVSLLGVYLGYTAAPGRRKLYGYLLMHAGAAAGFMAKSAPGWLVPGLALLTLIAWERRWSELRRPELYAGFLLQAIIIGPWIIAVARSPHGAESLRVLFWYNLAGRFAHIAAPAAYRYSAAHRNSAGKYFIELPVYLLPWTALAAVAAWHARKRLRLRDSLSSVGATATAWRFAVAACLPFLLLLTLAATARDIYAAPALLGVSLLIALEVSEAQRLAGQDRRDDLLWTRRLVATIACVFALALLVLCVGSVTSNRTGPPVAVVVGEYCGAAVVMFLLVWSTLRRAAAAQRRGHVLRGFQWTYAAYAVAFCLSSLAAFPTIDRWQDLPLLAAQIHSDTEHASLALLNPDETTVAMLDRRLRTPFTTLTTDANSPPQVVARDWFAAHGKDARLLVLLPGHASGELTPLLECAHLYRPPDDGIASELQADGVASIMRRYELPHGRRYALLGPPNWKASAASYAIIAPAQLLHYHIPMRRISESNSARLTQVKAELRYRLRLRFANGKSFSVDLADDIEHFKPYRSLRDRRLFTRVALGEDGYSIVWPLDGLDMGADTLWQYALEQNGRRDAAEFIRWRWRHRLSLAAAANALGISRRQVAYYVSGEHEVPRTVLLACKGWEAERKASPAA